MIFKAGDIVKGPGWWIKDLMIECQVTEDVDDDGDWGMMVKPLTGNPHGRYIGRRDLVKWRKIK